MLDERTLSGLAENVVPDDTLRQAAKQKMMTRISSTALTRSVASVQPSMEKSLSIKDRVLRTIHPPSAEELSDLASSVVVPAGFSRVRGALLARLEPVHRPLVQSSLKWTAAFALFLLIIRSMPLILLAPPTLAEVNVQLIPAGDDVAMFVGGVWQTITTPQAVTSPVMVRTGVDSRATLILNDDGVLRLAPNSTVKLHDLSDRPHVSSDGPTATVVRGEIWALGLLPPIIDGLTLETSEGTLSLNSGSASVTQDENGVDVSVYDRGVTFQRGEQTVFLVSGEDLSAVGTQQVRISTLASKAYAQPWVTDNLSQDAVHRADIAALQEKRRVERAGILPTSFLYPAKRIAEEVDLLFTLTHDGRTEKRIEQANTRLSEALALVKDGQNAEASAPLSEYKTSLIALAADENDNLVQSLIKKQIADASATLTAPTDPQADVQLLADAVSQVGAAIPDADLKPKDIEGYVLVDKLAEINKILSVDHDAAAAAASYADIQPYIKGLLDANDGTHPLLRKEAISMLVTTSSLLKGAAKTETGQQLLSMAEDVDQYVPQEHEQITVSEDELNQRVANMISRIFIFRHPLSRYNQLLVEMQNIETDPNRGTLLRRLKAALPPGLGEYVNTEIKKLGDELKQ